MKAELELDCLRAELRDYKAAVKYMRVLFKQQQEKYHRHLKKDHRDPNHSMAWQTCLGLPCRIEREELAKVEAVIEQYKLPGDPRGAPDGAAFQTSSAKAVANRKIEKVEK